MKRGRSSGGSVTGGTGDVKPQILTAAVPDPGANDDYATATVNLPIPRFGTMKTKATVFEILTVDWYPFLDATAEATGSTVAAYLSTQSLRSNNETCTIPTIVEDLEDPTVFGAVVWGQGFDTSGMRATVWPLTYDFTDKNGNGFVFASDRMIITVGGVSNSNSGKSVVKIKYRLINIGISEYVGIVQSQQG